MYNCEKCGKIVNTKYGSGRFCSQSCANARILTEEHRLKISKSLTRSNGTHTCKFCKRVSETTKAGNDYHEKGCKKNPSRISRYLSIKMPQTKQINTIKDLSTRTISKVIKRLQIPCSACGWYVEDVVGDLHHIVSRKDGGTNEHSNLTYICPNCHRKIHSGLYVNYESLEKQVGEVWKNFYSTKLR